MEHRTRALPEPSSRRPLVPDPVVASLNGGRLHISQRHAAKGRALTTNSSEAPSATLGLCKQPHPEGQQRRGVKRPRETLGGTENIHKTTFSQGELSQSRGKLLFSRESVASDDESDSIFCTVAEDLRGSITSSSDLSRECPPTGAAFPSVDKATLTDEVGDVMDTLLWKAPTRNAWTQTRSMVHDTVEEPTRTPSLDGAASEVHMWALLLQVCSLLHSSNRSRV